jgi:N4-gp56 family major capsid protein
MVAASTGIATEPVAQAYISIVSPDTTFDLQDDAAFVPVEKYSAAMTVMEGEVGKIKDVRFIETPNAKVFAGAGASSVDVHGTIIMGMEAYGVSRISGAALQNIVKPLGSGGTDDPLNQRGTTGWKGTFVAKILNDDFLGRIEHGVTG